MFGAAQDCFEAVAEISPTLDVIVMAAGSPAVAAHQRYRRARALLRLCTAFWPRAMMLGGEDETDRDSLALVRLLFTGLGTILPMVDLELLHIPGVCREFFELVQVVVDCFPTSVAKLAPAQFQALMESLAWGLDADVETAQTQRLCLQTMGAMAEHAFNTRGRSAEVFATLLDASSQNGQALLQCLHGLFSRLLFGAEMSVDMVHIAAELALPLILCYELPFQTLVRDLVALSFRATLPLEMRVTASFN
jgi:hypothetical protein